MPALMFVLGNDLEEMREDIATLVTAISILRAVDDLISAVESIPPADLTAEGEAVAAAAARVRAELDKLNPAVPNEPPAEEPPAEPVA